MRSPSELIKAYDDSKEEIISDLWLMLDHMEPEEPLTIGDQTIVLTKDNGTDHSCRQCLFYRYGTQNNCLFRESGCGDIPCKPRYVFKLVDEVLGE